jgi:thiol-disulfide isomerase/thioredoxin
MKKFLLFILICFIITNQSFSQSQRKVLIEHFTQASCGPCATVNPIISPIIERNASKVTKITHQVSWPGVDPMNKDNPGEVQNRVNYYGVTGVPDVFLDAYSSGNPTATITDATIQNAYLKPSPYDITIVNKVLPDYNSIEVNVTVKLTGIVSGNPMLRVAALEKVITWATPPGSNGERVFHHVVKKFLPNTNGTNISEINQIGQSKTYTFIYKFEKLYDFKTLETAAFIQNDATKEIYQSNNASVDFKPTQGDDVAIKLSNATGVYGDTIVCGTKTTPVVKVINTGNKTVTSMDIVYSINSGNPSTFRWTGKLDFLKEIDITLPAIHFTPYKGSNQLTIEIPTINDVEDINTINNVSILSFNSAPSTSTTSRFEMTPGTQPGMLAFVIRDENNKLILQDGPFPNNSTKKYDLTLEKDKCYRVLATNNTVSLNGTYKIFDDQNNLVFQQRVIGVGSFSRDFGTHTLITSTGEEFADSFFELFPNPGHDKITLQLYASESGISSLHFYNTSGQMVLSNQIPVYTGNNSLQLDISTLR